MNTEIRCQGFPDTPLIATNQPRRTTGRGRAVHNYAQRTRNGPPNPLGARPDECACGVRLELSLQDALNEGLYDRVAYLNGDLMAVLRIDDGTSIAHTGTDLLGQQSSLGRARAVIQTSVQNKYIGTDRDRGSQH